MNKIKKAWRENRVMFVLTVIVVICIVIICGVMLKYFFGASTSSYGSRLDNVANFPVTNEMQETIKGAFSGDTLSTATVDIKGKIIYVIVNFNIGIALGEAQSKALASYNTLDENYKKLYDFNITLTQVASEGNAGFRMMGAKNINSSAFTWSNNTPVSDGEN